MQTGDCEGGNRRGAVDETKEVLWDKWMRKIEKMKPSQEGKSKEDSGYGGFRRGAERSRGGENEGMGEVG